MPITDEQPNNEYQPIHIPDEFFPNDTPENKIIYALAELGEATINEVIAKVKELEPGNEHDQLTEIVTNVLNHFSETGSISSREKDGDVCYNLSKMSPDNEDVVNPE